MQKKKYRLIVSDFDGTLLRDDQTVAQETVRTIEEFCAKGGYFAICTGRTPKSILPRLQELRIGGLVSSFSGSVVFEAESGKVIVDGYMPQETAISVCQTMQTLGLHIHVYTLDDYYSSEDGEILRMYEKLSGVKGIVSEILLSELIKERNLKVRKINVIVPTEKREEIFEKLTKAHGADCCVTYSTAFMIEVSSKEYSKGTALKTIAENYGVGLEDTLAVGDSLNDLPMLQEAGLGLAVKNADGRLKEEVRVYEYSNDENAVGRIIEEFGETKEKI